VPDDSSEDMMVSITNGVSNNATRNKQTKQTPSPSGIVAVGLGSSLWKDLQPYTPQGHLVSTKNYAKTANPK